MNINLRCVIETGVPVCEPSKRRRKGIWKETALKMAAPHKNGDDKWIFSSVAKTNDGNLTYKQSQSLYNALAREGMKGLIRRDEDGHYRVWRIE
jgi:hypothetical protein